MKIRRVAVNNRKAQIELTTSSGRVFPVPYAKLDPRPTPKNRIREVHVDKELASEAVTYVLESGNEGSVHIDHALDYNEDPSYLAELLIHKLTVEARRRVDRAGLSRRELARRLSTSVPQLYRLLDPSNTQKSLGQLVGLLHLLDCDVQLVVSPRRAA
ncbi:MAG: XRE family transcriptional regulator [Deltaproteobacteria bacterium]|nr:XRE family transcriptional regulator [Deltaproteobacteria bacterium]